MEEEVFTKVSIPLFEDKELEIFDNNIHNIIEEYSKMVFKEKDQILTQRIIIKQEQKNNDLQDKIDKAIEYIENEMPYLEEPDEDYENNHKMIEFDRSDLLDILRGEDNE